MDVTPLYNDVETCLYTEGGIYGARPGDAAPLVVFRPMWLAKDIGQSSPYPGCTNTLTVTLSTNVPLVSDCGSVSIQMWNFWDRSTYVQSDSLVVDTLTTGAPQGFTASAGGLAYSFTAVEVADPPSGSVRLSSLQGQCLGRESGVCLLRPTTRTHVLLSNDHVL